MASIYMFGCGRFLTKQECKQDILPLQKMTSIFPKIQNPPLWPLSKKATFTQLHCLARQNRSMLWGFKSDFWCSLALRNMESMPDVDALWCIYIYILYYECVIHLLLQRSLWHFVTYSNLRRVVKEHDYVVFWFAPLPSLTMTMFHLKSAEHHCVNLLYLISGIKIFKGAYRISISYTYERNK